MEVFWHRWRKEYVVAPQERQRWRTTRRNMQVGDVVLMKEDESHHPLWPLGLVVEAPLDDDGLVRKGLRFEWGFYALTAYTWTL